MNFRHLILSTLFILICTLGFTQKSSNKADLLFGPEFKAGKMTLIDVIGHDDTGYYALQSMMKSGYSAPKYFLQKFNSDLELELSQEVELRFDDDKYNFERILYFQDQLVLLASKKDKKAKMNSLYISTIDKNSLEVDANFKYITTIDFSGKMKIEYNASYSFVLSRSENKILVKYEIPFKKGKEPEKFGIAVIDEYLNIEWEKLVTLPYYESEFGLNQVKVDDDGDVYVIGKLYGQTLDEVDKRLPKNKRGGNFEYRVIAYKNEGLSEFEFPIVLKGQYITDTQIAINKDKEIICTGFYSERGVFSVKGHYFMKLNSETGEVITENQNEFSEAFLKEGLTEKEEKKFDKRKEKGRNQELREYKLDEIILKDDGSAVLVGEQWYVREVTRTSRGANGITSTYTTYYYHFNSILVINFDSEGNEIWTEKIKKNQVSTNDGGFYSSFVLTVVDDQMFFVYNDNPKNIINEVDDRIYGAYREKEIALALSSIDLEGFYEKEMLFSQPRKELISVPKASEQISENELIIFCQRKKNQQFVKVTFK